MFKKLLIVFMLFSVSAAVCMEEERVTIRPHQGEDSKVDVKLAKLSKTIKDLIEDVGTDNPIPLPSVPGPIWEKIQEQLGRLEIIVNKVPKDQKSEAAFKKAEAEIIKALQDLDGKTLVELIAAANYLDIPDLLRLAMDVAKQVDIKKITPVQIAALPKEIRNPIILGQMMHILGQWQIKQLHELKGHTGWVFSVCVTPDGSKIVSASRDKTIRVWDIKSGTQLREFNGHTQPVASVCVTPDGSKIVSGSGDRTIRVWDINNGTQLHELKGHTNRVSSVCVTPQASHKATPGTADGSKIVSGSSDNTIRIWDIKSGNQLAELTGHTGRVESVCVTPDGSKIVSGSSDETIRVWDINNPTQPPVVLTGHTEETVWSVCVTPDGRKIVSGSADHTIRVLDIKDGKQLHEFKGHIDDVTSVSVTPDGTKIVSGSVDNTIRVWDINNGTQLHELKGHTNRVSSVCVTPDGSKIVSGSWDNTIRVWDISLINLLDRLHAMNNEQIKKVWKYLQDGHKDGWDGIQAILR